MGDHLDESVAALRSVALSVVDQPDVVDVIAVSTASIPGADDVAPDEWARLVFDVRSTPWWVTALFALRQLVAPVIGARRATHSMFRVREVVGPEAIVHIDDDHLEFCAAIAHDSGARLLRMTTVVRLKGWRGRLYWAPVGCAHGPVVRSMLLGAVRRLRADA